MRRFWSDTNGNIAVLFALAIVPVIGGIGAAVDYSMASAYRTDMQKALDSTALALSKIIPLEGSELNAVANQYFQASFGNHDLTNLQLTVTPEQGKVRIAVTGDYTPKIANIFGATQFTIGTSAEAVWNMGKVEIALVLDVSLSMNDHGRIQALRNATVDLINVLETAARQPGDAKVGIVAFDGMVNVGQSNSNANWLRWDWWDANSYDSINNRCKTASGTSINFNLSSVPPGKWLAQHCSEQSVSSCQGASASNSSQCKQRGGTWITQFGIWTPYARNNWRGCVYDRENHLWPAGQNLTYDVNDDEPDATHPFGHASETLAQRRTKVPAARCYSANNPPQQITPLTEDWTLLKQRANALTPTGWTNITIGMTWGFHLLSPTPLFTEGAAYGTEDLTKYVILMTDGYNTKSVWKEPGSCPTTGPCPDIDARTEAVCNNIKATNNIQIFTVRLMQGNETLLRNCASNPGMYHDVQAAGQLAGVFTAIGSEIASLHLSK